MAKGEDWHWRGFLRPVWRDPIFWFAIVVSALLVAAQVALLGWNPSSGGWWARLAIQAVLTVIVVLSIVGTGAGITRGWERGTAEAAARKRR